MPVAPGGGPGAAAGAAGRALALRLRLAVPVRRHSQWPNGCGVALAVTQWHAVALACQSQSWLRPGRGPGRAQLRAPPSARPGSDISRLRLAAARPGLAEGGRTGGREGG